MATRWEQGGGAGARRRAPPDCAAAARRSARHGPRLVDHRAGRAGRRPTCGDRRHHHPAAAHRSTPAATPGRPVRRGRHPARRGVALAHLLGDVAAGRSVARRHGHRAPGGTVSRSVADVGRHGPAARPTTGEFVLPEPVSEKLLFVTAGSGVTPVMGMLRHLAATRPEVLAGAVAVHCDRTDADVVFAASCCCCRLRPGCAWSRGTPPATAGTRRRPCRSRARLGGTSGWRARPANLLDDLADWWDRHGDRDALHVERFVRRSRRQRPAPAGASGSTEADRGRRRPWRAAHACRRGRWRDPAAGCRMGICHTCVGRLRSGAVTNLHTGERNDTPGNRCGRAYRAPPARRDRTVEIELWRL